MSEPNNSINAPQDAQTSTSGQETRPLETIPTSGDIREEHFPPNTPLAASTTSFILGSLFSLASWFVLSHSGVISAIYYGDWQKVAFNQPLVQVSLFFSAWSFFHWAEFAITAGWNREKCSTSCKSPFPLCYFVLTQMLQRSYLIMAGNTI
jgi:protein-S-isoprenylcysteine O-methyltransferase